MRYDKNMKRKIVVVVLFLAAAALGFLGVRMATFSTDIEMVSLIKSPDPMGLSDMIEGDFRQKAIAIDGKILQGTGISPQPTASTAKMILSLAVMEKKPFSKGETGENIEITQEFYDKYRWYYYNHGSVTRVAVGEVISEYDALSSTLLASSNNMADSLAIWAFGSMEEYKNYATGMLKRIGVNNTVIGVDASGYDESTISTAEDLATIGARLMENPVLAEIVGMKSLEVPVAGVIKNGNKLLGENGVSGVKTGYIGSSSGYCLVSAFLIDEHVVTIAVLGSETRGSSFEVSRAEVAKLKEEIVPIDVVLEGETVGFFDSWWLPKTEIKAKQGIKVLSTEINGDSEVILKEDNVRLETNEKEYVADVEYEDFNNFPSLFERFLHVFGWERE